MCPLAIKSLDQTGLVMNVSSFSKSLAPGYRLGWVAAGRYAQRIQRLKLSASLATTIPVQIALAEFLKHGELEPHLRRLRARLEHQQTDMVRAIESRFPPGTRLSCPQGGYFLWVELPAGTDSLAVHRMALDEGISIAPGPIFSAKREYGHCIRLNYGHPWGPDIDAAISRLAAIVQTVMLK
jgi:DNA-binding transcriptional MocR family regulator